MRHLLYDVKGTFEITSAGSIVVSADATGATIDSSSLSGPMHVQVELVPLDFTLLGVSQDRISLPGVDGELQRLDDSGTVVQQNTLKGDSVTVSYFDGVLRMKDGKMMLQGLASGVEGNTFKIPK